MDARKYLTAGMIRNREFMRQIQDFTGLRYGTITPTNLDFVIEKGKRLFIFGELKYGSTPLKGGQMWLLERMVDGLTRPHVHAVAFVAEHHAQPPADIPTADCLIRDVYTCADGWHQPPQGTTVLAFCDGLMG